LNEDFTKKKFENILQTKEKLNKKEDEKKKE